LLSSLLALTLLLANKQTCGFVSFFWQGAHFGFVRVGLVWDAEYVVEEDPQTGMWSRPYYVECCCCCCAVVAALFLVVNEKHY